jgi:peptidyl-prolyl cis-trans isomerase SurA
MVLAVLALPVAVVSARAEGQGVIATVNDIPITGYDIDQRTRLGKMLGERKNDSRQRVLQVIMDENIKISEATKYKANPTDKEVEDQAGRLAQGLKTDLPGLKSKLAAQNISYDTVKRFIAAQISFSRILSGKFKVEIKVDPAEVDKKYAEIKNDLQGKVNAIMKDPRMQPQDIYTILEINFPVENQQDQMLLQARAVEANQYLGQFKGCGSARKAASGIFNVKIGKPIDALAAKIPGPLRKALEGAGVGRAIGPARGPSGIQLIAFCGRKKIVPPKPNVTLPTRDQAEIIARNEKYDALESKYMAILRKSALIEYKDQSFATQ